MALCNWTKQDTHFTRPPRTATDFLPLLSGWVLFFSGRPVGISHSRLEAVRISQNRTRKNRHATGWFDRTLCTKLNGERVWYSILVFIFGLCGGIATTPPRRPLSRILGRYGYVVGLSGKGRDRANVGLTWGWKEAAPSQAPRGAER